MQDLYAERAELFDALMAEVRTLKTSGCQYAENEAEYRKALAVAILEERDGNTPVTIVGDICRGREDIAEKKRLRDCSRALYEASGESINAIKLKIRTVEEDIRRMWSSGGAGEWTYL